MAAFSRRGRRAASAPSVDASEATADALKEATEAEAAESVSDAGSAAAAPDAVAVPGRRGWSGPRLVALVAGVAVGSLLIGVAAMQFIVSPAEMAAKSKPPEPGPITTPVELRTIENTVITRGEVNYADAVDVTIDTAGGEDRPVVTGHVPTIGTELKAGNIALEVAGRPVIVLPGGLPAYRSLSIGMRGPDVVQLKTALTGLGFAAGDASNDTFEWDTASALGALYEQIGYSAATGGEATQEGLRGAERSVRDANVMLAQAQASLEQARADKMPSLVGEQAAVDSAYTALSDAQEQLAQAQQAVLPTMPASEVLFLESLPRRVDAISVARGDILSGSPMSVSGATLTIIGSVSKQDAELLADGTVAYFPGPDGEELTATVQKIIAPKKSGTGSGAGGDTAQEGGGNSGGNAGGSAGSRYEVHLTPGKLTPEQLEAVRGTNVRVRIPVASTEGEVLAVPIAALSAGSGGEDRVELLVDLKDGPNAVTEIVTVTAGLAADGYVEVTSEDPRIKAGAKVVVGK
ncbi:efflux RND transporter periplasmic adaptor subunit [Leucobacter salsicius]|uniref:hypothetical protein n=1 Tax=Leucobacter salsicius TaxID=664638 RepID=UPI00034A782F|nr:hypothetical protein [Leucobacter salsicius]